MSYPKTYQEANAIGFKHYYTGKKCKRGHINLRYASSKECVTCRLHKNQSDELKAKQKEYHNKNRELINYKTRQRYNLNAEKERLRTRNKYKFNKERVIETNKKWIQNNSEKYLSYIRIRNAQRRLMVKQQMPKWANKDTIREIYKNKPDGYHVDHIIPLKGKLVSGLHVEYNLQYLTASENSRKNNHYYGA
jgi:hypothetical protein